MGSVDDQDPQSRTCEQHRSGSARDAGSNNDDVVGHDLAPEDCLARRREFRINVT
jgi:hypothetical protein